MVVAVVDDLLFSSKIRAVAAAAGESVAFVRNPDSVAAAVREHRPRLIIIDLDRDTLRPTETIAAIRSLTAPSDTQQEPSAAGIPRIVGFGAHVNVERLRAARDAGADDALARSAFVAMLPALLTPVAAADRDR